MNMLIITGLKEIGSTRMEMIEVKVVLFLLLPRRCGQHEVLGILMKMKMVNRRAMKRKTVFNTTNSDSGKIMLRRKIYVSRTLYL